MRGSLLRRRRRNSDILKSWVVIDVLPGKSFFFLDLEHLVDQVLSIVMNLLGESQWLRLDVAVEVWNGMSSPWKFSEQNFVEEDTSGPDITFSAVVFIIKDLRSHVKGSSEQGVGLSGVLVDFINQFSETKVSDLDSALMEQNIRSLNITMHNNNFVALRIDNVQVFKSHEGMGDLLQDRTAFFFSERLLGLQFLFEISTITVISEDVKIVGSSLDI